MIQVVKLIDTAMIHNCKWKTRGHILAELTELDLPDAENPFPYLPRDMVYLVEETELFLLLLKYPDAGNYFNYTHQNYRHPGFE